MNAPRQIPPAVTDLQIEASDPGHSAFVAANAGSGKTHVLAQRVIRLLLSGVDPARILCITFTKAAAANMANRVFDELRKWTRLDDAGLDAAMQAAGVGRPSAALRRRARQLFALALETPGGLKVQTIHAFCTQLLHLFPFEANVAARFEVLDEPTEAQLLEELSLSVMLRSRRAAGQPARPGARRRGPRCRRRRVPGTGARDDPQTRCADALDRSGGRRAAGHDRSSRRRWACSLTRPMREIDADVLQRCRHLRVGMDGDCRRVQPEHRTGPTRIRARGSLRWASSPVRIGWRSISISFAPTDRKRSAPGSRPKPSGQRIRTCARG